MSYTYGPLPGLNIDTNLVTAAGFSSGSYFSHFMHVCNSSIIKGSGLLNGSIYATQFSDRIMNSVS